MARRRVWTVGHSTHGVDAFLALLTRHEIATVADVRAIPRSRRHPHFAAEALEHSLAGNGIAYRHLAGLGGRRRPLADSPNGAWQNDSFRGYADHALGPRFAQALAELAELAAAQRTAVMCAEALWWRCHRRLIADRLTAGGWEVCHIGADGRAGAHVLAPFAVIRPDGAVVYPAGTEAFAAR